MPEVCGAGTRIGLPRAPQYAAAETNAWGCCQHWNPVLQCVTAPTSGHARACGSRDGAVCRVVDRAGVAAAACNGLRDGPSGPSQLYCRKSLLCAIGSVRLRWDCEMMWHPCWVFRRLACTRAHACVHVLTCWPSYWLNVRFCNGFYSVVISYHACQRVKEPRRARHCGSGPERFS